MADLHAVSIIKESIILDDAEMRVKEGDARLSDVLYFIVLNQIMV